jgi:hypothetical protein
MQPHTRYRLFLALKIAGWVLSGIFFVSTVIFGVSADQLAAEWIGNERIAWIRSILLWLLNADPVIQRTTFVVIACLSWLLWVLFSFWIPFSRIDERWRIREIEVTQKQREHEDAISALRTKMTEGHDELMQDSARIRQELIEAREVARKQLRTARRLHDHTQLALRKWRRLKDGEAD